MRSWNLPYLSLSLRGAKRRSNPILSSPRPGLLRCARNDGFKLDSTHALNLSACNRDGLSCDRAGSFAAQPKHGIGDFRRGHEARLRIMSGKFSHRLLVAAAGFFHDVVDTAGEQIGIGETGAMTAEHRDGRSRTRKRG